MTREEAINKVRQMSLPKETMEILEALAPELAESEDERMIREIKRYIKEQGDKPNGLPNGTVAVADMIAWLEKRGGRDIDCPQKHQDNSQPNGCIVLEDFNGGEGFYKLNLDYLNKKQVEEVEEMVRTWNKESKASNENIKACIGMCLTDANEQRFKDYNTSLKDCLAYLEEQKEYISNNFDDVWDEEDCEEIIAEGQKLTPRFKELLKEVCHAWYDRGAKLEKQKEQKQEKFPPYVTGFKGDPDPAGTSDLEEAAKEYASKTLCDPDDGPSTGLAKESFIAGAEWQKEQKSAEWSEEDEERLKAICTYLQDYPRLAKINDVKRFNEYCDWLKSLPLNLKKKNEDVAKLCSNEWSEEDKAHRDFILESLENQIRFCKKDAKGAHYTKQIRTAQNWLKSLPERFNFESKPAECNKVTINGEPIPTENHSMDIPLAEWSDEDEKTIDDAFCWLCEYAGSLIQKNYGKSSMLYGIANKLKSIHPQYHGDVTMTEAYKMGKEAGEASRWKPTEHQMTILKAVKEYVGKGSGYWGEGLGSLINDLEKLI